MQYATLSQYGGQQQPVRQKQTFQHAPIGSVTPPVYMGGAYQPPQGDGNVAHAQVVPPGAIGGDPGNPIYGPNGPGSLPGGGWMPGYGPGGQTPNPIDWGQVIGQQPQPNPMPSPIPGGQAPGGDFTWRPTQGYNPVPPTQKPTQGGMPAPPTLGGAVPNAPQFGGQAAQGQLANLGDGTSYGGVSTVNPQASQLDYNNLNQFIDTARENAMSDLQPQLDMQDRAFEQSLINKGIDPTSPRAKEMMAMKNRGQNDMRSQVAFDAMGFGRDTQGQMFNQAATRSGMAGQMQGLNWDALLGNAGLSMQNAGMANDFNLGTMGLNAGVFGDLMGYAGNQDAIRAGMYGDQLGFQSALNRNQTDQYLGDLRHKLGMANYGLGKDTLNWNKTMDLEGLNQQQQLMQEDQRRWNWQAMLGLTPQTPQVGGGINPGNIGNPFSPWAELLKGFDASVAGGG